jgi:hypothetical protein
MNAPNTNPAGTRRSLLAGARVLLAHEPSASTSGTAAAPQGQGATTLRPRPLTAALKWLFWALVAAFAAFFVLNLFAPAGALGPDVALAQQGGGGGAGGSIEGAIQNARDWLAGIMVSLGGLGFIASVAIKAVARTNENMHHAAHMGMTGSGIAVLAGLLVNDIIDLIASWAGG